MKTQLITWHHNHKGGINNLNVVQVRDMRHNTLKSFSSLKSMEHAIKRAKAFQNKVVNNFYYIMIWLDNSAPCYSITKPYYDFNTAINEADMYAKENNVMFSINTPEYRNQLDTTLKY